MSPSLLKSYLKVLGTDFYYIYYVRIKGFTVFLSDPIVSKILSLFHSNALLFTFMYCMLLDYAVYGFHVTLCCIQYHNKPALEFIQHICS